MIPARRLTWKSTCATARGTSATKEQLLVQQTQICSGGGCGGDDAIIDGGDDGGGGDGDDGGAFLAALYSSSMPFKQMVLIYRCTCKYPLPLDLKNDK